MQPAQEAHLHGAFLTLSGPNGSEPSGTQSRPPLPPAPRKRVKKLVRRHDASRSRLYRHTAASRAHVKPSAKTKHVEATRNPSRSHSPQTEHVDCETPFSLTSAQSTDRASVSPLPVDTARGAHVEVSDQLVDSFTQQGYLLPTQHSYQANSKKLKVREGDTQYSILNFNGRLVLLPKKPEGSNIVKVFRGEGFYGSFVEAIDLRTGEKLGVKISKITTDFQEDLANNEAKYAAKTGSLLGHLKVHSRKHNLQKHYHLYRLAGSDLFNVIKHLKSHFQTTFTFPSDTPDEPDQELTGDQVYCKLLLDTLSELTVLHRRRIVHRDLKDENVLLFESGPKLCDLAFADKIRNPKLVPEVLSHHAPEHYFHETEIGNIIKDVVAYISFREFQDSTAVRKLPPEERQVLIQDFGTKLYELFNSPEYNQLEAEEILERIKSIRISTNYTDNQNSSSERLSQEINDAFQETLETYSQFANFQDGYSVSTDLHMLGMMVFRSFVPLMQQAEIETLRKAIQQSLTLQYNVDELTRNPERHMLVLNHPRQMRLNFYNFFNMSPHFRALSAECKKWVVKFIVTCFTPITRDNAEERETVQMLHTLKEALHEIAPEFSSVTFGEDLIRQLNERAR